MTRSLWKGYFSEVAPNSSKIWSRRSMITPPFLFKNLLIYNGKNFITLKVTEEMIGHKFGEFANTRKKPKHKKKIQKKK